MIENSTGTIVITAGQVRIGTVVRATAWTASMDGWLRVHGRDRVFKRNQSTCAMMFDKNKIKSRMNEMCLAFVFYQDYQLCVLFVFIQAPPFLRHLFDFGLV